MNGSIKTAKWLLSPFLNVLQNLFAFTGMEIQCQEEEVKTRSSKKENEAEQASDIGQGIHAGHDGILISLSINSY